MKFHTICKYVSGLGYVHTILKSASVCWTMKVHTIHKFVSVPDYNSSYHLYVCICTHTTIYFCWFIAMLHPQANDI